jgi:hypothetical protein
MANEPARKIRRRMSGEALIGLGVTIAGLGVLGLLLGWAQSMRGVADNAVFWFIVGAIALVLGLVICGMARGRDTERP